jgi:hypothetical protein
MRHFGRTTACKRPKPLTGRDEEMLESRKLRPKGKVVACARGVGRLKEESKTTQNSLGGRVSYMKGRKERGEISRQMRQCSWLERSKGQIDDGRGKRQLGGRSGD